MALSPLCTREGKATPGFASALLLQWILLHGRLPDAPNLQQGGPKPCTYFPGRTANHGASPSHSAPSWPWHRLSRPWPSQPFEMGCEPGVPGPSSSGRGRGPGTAGRSPGLVQEDQLQTHHEASQELLCSLHASEVKRNGLEQSPRSAMEPGADRAEEPPCPGALPGQPSPSTLSGLLKTAAKRFVLQLNLGSLNHILLPHFRPHRRCSTCCEPPTSHQQQSLGKFPEPHARMAPPYRNSCSGERQHHAPSQALHHAPCGWYLPGSQHRGCPSALLLKDSVPRTSWSPGRHDPRSRGHGSRAGCEHDQVCKFPRTAPLKRPRSAISGQLPAPFLPGSRPSAAPASPPPPPFPSFLSGWPRPPQPCSLESLPGGSPSNRASCLPVAGSNGGFPLRPPRYAYSATLRGAFPVPEK